jgi:4-diphosphocytidyl-2-C-methyl-D-erythritol kinase
MTIKELAPAKINLTLHVTGQRADGYHLLDSLVVFADIGDHITVEQAKDLSLTLTGPEAGPLQADPDNLVLRAARLLHPTQGAHITLDKQLPVASGIGGGSADAAATLRALSSLWQRPLPEQTVSLGADVPVCLAHTPRRMQGIGDHLSSVPQLPEMDIVLINPRVAVSTPEIFKTLTHKTNPAMPKTLPTWPDLGALCTWLQSQRNDLQPVAMTLQPVILNVLTFLKENGAHHAAMSGSGATCYGLFPKGKAPTLSHPHWWIRSGRVL